MKHLTTFLFIIFISANICAQVIPGKLLPNQLDSTRIKYVKSRFWGFGIGLSSSPFQYTGFEALSDKLNKKYPNNSIRIQNENRLTGLLYYVYYKYQSVSYEFGGSYSWTETAKNWESYLAINYYPIKEIYFGSSINIMHLKEDIHVGASISSNTYSNTYLESISIEGKIPSVKLYAGVLLDMLSVQGGYIFSFSPGTTIETVLIKPSTTGFFINGHVQIPIGGK